MFRLSECRHHIQSAGNRTDKSREGQDAVYRGMAVDEHIIVTELGVKKTRDMDIEDSILSESLEKCVKLF